MLTFPLTMANNISNVFLKEFISLRKEFSVKQMNNVK